jgi:DNA adenine methylase
MGGHSWLVSYDDVASIREIYGSFSSASYSIPYSVRTATHGKEVMFFSKGLILPTGLVGAAKFQSVSDLEQSASSLSAAAITVRLR